MKWRGVQLLILQKLEYAAEHERVMDVLNLIRKRRSVRKFKTRRIPEEKLLAILEAGRFAPSGADRQPLLMIVVDDRGLKSRIREKSEEADREWRQQAPHWFKVWAKGAGISPEKDFLTSAPLLLCIFGDCTAPYWLESVWIAIGYITLTATEQGLGCLTYTPGEMEFLNPLLGAPGHFKPVAIMPIGFPAESPSYPRRRRRTLREFVHVNRYGFRGGIPETLDLKHA